VSIPLQRVLDLMSEIASLRDRKNFSGLGVIFYQPPLSLPVIPLGGVQQFSYKLPVSGGKHMSQLLAEISSLTSPWHDGFHLVNSDLFAITHVSHFFSPPVDLVGPKFTSLAPMGARQMAAVLGSMLASVDYVALLNGRVQLSVFQRGRLVHKEE
jgi:hypothetical protein